MRHPSRSCSHHLSPAPHRGPGFYITVLTVITGNLQVHPLFSFPRPWLFSVASLRALYINAFSDSEKAKRPRAQIIFPDFCPIPY